MCGSEAGDRCVGVGVREGRGVGVWGGDGDIRIAFSLPYPEGSASEPCSFTVTENAQYALLFGDRVSLCNCGWPITCFVEQADLNSAEISLLLL